jgi:hypothetical protein
MKSLIVFNFLLLLTWQAYSQKLTPFEILDKPDQKKIDITFKGQLLTSYCYFDSIKKPFLFPINTVDGITVTRGYPVKPMPGERTDHPHHTGLWLNYESVNGLDFWNNSTAIPKEKKSKYGTIVHHDVLEKVADEDEAILTVTANWINSDGTILLKEKTKYVFSVKGQNFYITRSTTLSSSYKKVMFKDVKDGLLAIRVARELEMPSPEPGKYVAPDEEVSNIPLDNNPVTGRYYSSEGLEGDSVWGSKGSWAMLQGVKEGKPITIGIFDHPSNIGFPSYWHARGYGLFSINPLGRKVFSKGKEELNFTLDENESVTFRYKVLVASEKKTSKEMNGEAARFKEE